MILPRRLVLLSLLLGAMAAGPAFVGAQVPAEPPATEITAVQMEMRSTDTETITTFDGNVTVTGNNMSITCDHLVVVSLRLDDDQAKLVPRDQRFKSLIAEGNVKMVQGPREAFCARAEVLPGEDRITLTGKPMVTDREAAITWIGDELFLYRGERRVSGRNVRITAPPIQDLGFGDAKPAAGIAPPRP